MILEILAALVDDIKQALRVDRDVVRGLPEYLSGNCAQ